MTNNKLIVCDVDGVILNFSRGMKEHVWKNYDIYLSEDPMDWGWDCKEIGTYLKSMWASDDFSRLKVYPNTLWEVLMASHKVDADLMFLTDVPEYAFANRRRNLSSLGLTNFQIERASNKAAKIERLLSEYDAVMLIDDKTENVLDALKLQRVTVAYPVRGHNWNALRNTGAIPYNGATELYNIIKKWGGNAQS